jgi:hypothetical protein
MTRGHLIQGWARIVGFSMSLVLASCGGGSDGAAIGNSLVDGRSQALAVASTSPTAVVVALTKLSETRVSRTVYDYVFRVTIQNGVLPQAGVLATLQAVGAGATIVDGSALIGDVGANQVIASTDTVTIRQDRTYTFGSSALVWNVTGTPLADLINGFVVPLEPDSTSNNNTLAGIDTNKNGVRDDVERKLANLAKTPADFSSSLAYAAAFQNLFAGVKVTQRTDSLTAYSKVLCSVEKASSDVRGLNIGSLLITTNERQIALRSFFDVLVAYSAEELPPCTA